MDNINDTGKVDFEEIIDNFYIYEKTGKRVENKMDSL